MIKCESCGHTSVSKLRHEWNRDLPPALVDRMSTEFKAVDGELPDKTRFTTLFLSIGYQFFHALNPGAVETKDVEIFSEKIAPVLLKVDENFEILGCLAPPSAIQLAIVNHTWPRAVFTFVTVKATVDAQGNTEFRKIREKLKALGLERLLHDGEIDTIGDRQNVWPYFKELK